MNVLSLRTVMLALASSAILGQAQVFQNSAAISPARLKSHLEFIASDELAGRDTPSLGLDIATMYVATQLKLWGAKPGGENGTFFQKVPFRTNQLDPDKSALTLGDHMFVYGGGLQSANQPALVQGKLVYVGHGYILKGKNINPYEGLDVKGKILVTARGMPEGTSTADFVGQAGVDYAWPTLAAKDLGALGVIEISDEFQDGLWKREFSLNLGSPEPDTPAFNRGPGNGPGSVRVSSAVARVLFAGEKVSADEAASGPKAPETPFEFNASKEMGINISLKTIRKTAQNVIAIVPGTDPVLSKEYVAFGAHIDHVGTHPNGTADWIFNGADDDGSGTVSVLEIAHAMLTGPRPKRSCIFVWHVGEEMGMIGSEFFVNNPTVPLKQIITQLNVDMVGRTKLPGDTNPLNASLTGPNEVYVVGSTRMSTDLHKTSEAVNAKFQKMKFNYLFDDPKDQTQIFYRSDHYSYAQKGIPILFYYSGEHVDYHRATDEVSKIDFTKMTKIARTIYALGWSLGNLPKRPVVDKPLK